MLLAIDVGNSHTVFGLFRGEELVDHWRVATDAHRTADEWTVLMSGLIGASEAGGAIEGIAMCSRASCRPRGIRPCELGLRAAGCGVPGGREHARGSRPRVSVRPGRRDRYAFKAALPLSRCPDHPPSSLCRPPMAAESATIPGDAILQERPSAQPRGNGTHGGRRSGRGTSLLRPGSAVPVLLGR